ncbi:MAG: hypothetical protein QM783_01945 [Phycisphaerales bacterium]
MSRIHTLALSVALLLTAGSSVANAQTSLGSSFTYQGRLSSNTGATLTGDYDMRFSLWNAATGGSQVGSTLRFDGTAGNGAAITPADGNFTAALDFGAAAWTANQNRWLRVEVRPHDPANAAAYTDLPPRQQVTPTPLALYSQNTRGLNVDATGKIGIGTTTPGEKVEVFGGNVLLNGDSKGVIVDAQGMRRYGFMKYPNYAGGVWRAINTDFIFGRVTTGDVTTGSPSVIDLYLAANGNVGIGTSSAAATPSKLTVAGTIKSTTGGFVFPDGTTQTTTMVPFPGSTFVQGTINGAAGIWTAGNTAALASASVTSSSYMVSPGVYADLTNVPSGKALLTWSTGCWASAVGRVEFMPQVAGVNGQVVPFFFNTAGEHMTITGSCFIDIDTAGANAPVRLLWRSPNGVQFNTDFNDCTSWTLTVFRN